MATSQQSFIRGELTPLLEGRFDNPIYTEGVSKLQNYFINAAGGADYRSGLKYVSGTANNSAGRLVPFQIGSSEPIVIELTEELFRFYRNNGIINSAPTTPYTLSHIYPEAIIHEIQFAQYGNTIYFVHPYYPVHKLEYNSNVDWSFSEVSFTANPFMTDQSGTGVSVTPSATSGSGITVTATGGTPFSSTDVGKHISMTHAGTYGYAVITKFVSNTQVEVNVLVDFGNNTSTSSWTFGDGNPSCITFYEQRAVYAGGEKMYFSKSAADFENFTTGTNPADAMSYTIASDRINIIKWLLGGKNSLVVGTLNSEFIVSGGGENDAITPTNILVRPNTNFGSKNIQPVLAEGAIFFAERSGETVISYETDNYFNYNGVNRSVIADHLLRGKVKAFAYDRGEKNIIWVLQENGDLTGLSYDGQENVSAFARFVTNGEIQSITTIQRTNNDDELWVCVKRNINGFDKYFVEYLYKNEYFKQRRDYYTGDKEADDFTFLNETYETQKKQFFLDSGLTFDGKVYTDSLTLSAVSGNGITVTTTGTTFNFTSTDVGRQIWGVNGGRMEIKTYVSPTEITADVISETDFSSTNIPAAEWYITATTLSGLDHLIGEEVHVVTDGAIHPKKVVDVNGEIELNYPASMVHVGFNYEGNIISMILKGYTRDDISQTKIKTINKFGFRFLNTLGTQYGTDIYDLQEIQYRSTAHITNRPPPPTSGDQEVFVRDSFDTEKRYIIYHNKPLPSTILLVIIYMETSSEI